MLSVRQLKAVYGDEQVLIVLLARLYFSTTTVHEVEEYIRLHRIDWERVQGVAAAHTVTAFIYHVIRRNKLSVPQHVFEALEEKYDAYKRRSFSQYIFTAKTVAELSAQRVTVVPYKGAAFANRYYEEIGLRESLDVDLLVHPLDLPAIDTYLQSRGYRVQSPVPDRYHRYFTRFFKDHFYYHPSMVYGVEIQWRLVDRFSGDFPNHAVFAQHLCRDTAGELTPPFLSPTYDLLAIVSNHFVKDMFGKFKYLIDIACLLQKEQHNIDTAQLKAFAREYGFTRKLYVGFSLVHDFLGISLADITHVNTEAWRGIPLGMPPAVRKFYITEPAFWKLSLRLGDDLMHKLSFCARCLLYVFLPTQKDLARTQLAPAAVALLRPFRLLGELLRKKSEA